MTCVRSTLFFIALLAAIPVRAADVSIGDVAVGDEQISVLLREGADRKQSLAISTGSASSRQTFNLQTVCLDKQNPALGEALKISANSENKSLIAGFGLTSASGDARHVDVWLFKNGARWTLRGEWSVDKFNHQEIGEKDEWQSFVLSTNGNLRRTIKRNNIEGVETTCPQGCCKVWQTRTLVLEEEEVYAWDEAARALERKSFQKWYFAQTGDGLLSIARKIHGDLNHMASLYYLNPGLEKQAALADGQKILVEKTPR